MQESLSIRKEIFYDRSNDRTVLLLTDDQARLIGCNFMQGDDVKPDQIDHYLTATVVERIGGRTGNPGWLAQLHDVFWDYISIDQD